MSADRDEYVIVAELIADDRVGPGTRSAERRLLNFEQLGRRVSGTITAALGSAMAVFGAATLGGALANFTRLNGQMEQAEVGLATLLSAQLHISGMEAMGIASDQLQALRADAAAGVGELSDYMGGFQRILGPGLARGGSLEQLRELNRLAIAAGGALRGQEGMQLAPMDLVQALSGDISERETPFVMQALSAIQMTAEQFRALKPEERLATLTKAFGAFSEGAKLMGNTWDARLSTFKDHISALKLQLTAPLFNYWKDSLGTINDALMRSRDSLGVIVENWGVRLLAIWESLIKHAGTYSALVASAAFMPYAPVVGAGVSRGALAVTGAFAATAPLGAAIRDPFGMERMFAGFMGQSTAGMTAGLLPVLGQGLKGLLGIIGRLAWPITLVVTLFQALKGGMAEYAGSLSFLKWSWGTLMNAFGQLGESFTLMTGSGSALNLVGAGLGYLLGGLVLVITAVVKVIAALVVGFSTIIRIVGTLLNALMTWKNPLDGIVTAATEGQEQLHALWNNWSMPSTLTHPIEFDESRLEECLPDDIGEKPNAPVVNIGKMEVTIQTETMEDEARVARTMKTVLGKLQQHRTQPRRLSTALVGTG